MGPKRTASSSSQTSSTRRRKAQSLSGGRRDSDESALLGVQKIKSALRQTRRLLAKETLAADVRVATQRRLKALEADLATAQQKRKERTLAAKYHKVKFFERKKVTRKIKQIKHGLAAPEGDETPSSKDARAELENILYELRVDLNYILHYPKLEKYISLFSSKAETGDEEDPVSADQLKSNARRAAIRESIKNSMDAGELSREPELDREVNPIATDKSSEVIRRPREVQKTLSIVEKQQRLRETSKTAGSQKVDSKTQRHVKQQGVRGDDFFSAESQSEPEADNVSDDDIDMESIDE